MLKIRKAAGFWDWQRIRWLYKRAFPKNERKPISAIKNLTKQGLGDVFVIDDGGFLGFATTMEAGDRVLLDYFAIKKSCRGKGFGGLALKRIKELFKDKRLVVEIERADIPSSDQKTRKARKRFYLNQGLVCTGITVVLFGVRMELLAANGTVTFEEYKDIYLTCAGSKIAKNVVLDEG